MLQARVNRALRESDPIRCYMLDVIISMRISLAEETLSNDSFESRVLKMHVSPDLYLQPISEKKEYALSGLKQTKTFQATVPTFATCVGIRQVRSNKQTAAETFLQNSFATYCHTFLRKEFERALDENFGRKCK